MHNSAPGMPKGEMVGMLGQGEEAGFEGVGPDLGLLGCDGWLWKAAFCSEAFLLWTCGNTGLHGWHVIHHMGSCRFQLRP